MNPSILLSTEGFVPRWMCGNFTDIHGWTHIISDIAIFAAYMTIPVMILTFMFIKKQVIFPRVFWLFAGFIAFCGTVHLIEAIIFWYPIYRLDAALKVCTAIVSIGTVIALLKVVPEALKLPTIFQTVKDLSSLNSKLSEKNLEIEKVSSYKSLFLANMSHELKTPLNSMLLISETMLRETDSRLNDEDRRCLQIINECGKDLNQLITDILDLSRIEMGKVNLEKREFDIYELCQSIHDQNIDVAKAKGLSLDFAAKGKSLFILQDPIRVKQILTNLVSNSIKFTEEGAVTININYDDDFCKITVADTGIGISQEQQGKIFTAFEQGDDSYTKKQRGTGLGLTISKRLATLMGGDIELKSKVGEGSQFTLVLPLVTAYIENKEQDLFMQHPSFAPTETHTELEGKKVLIVEDDITCAFALSKNFVRSGLEPEIVDNGKLAIQKIGTKVFDFIILDYNLPDMTGSDVYEEIKNHPNIERSISVLTSAFSEIQPSLLAQIDVVHPKPINFPKLISEMSDRFKTKMD